MDIKLDVFTVKLKKRHKPELVNFDDAYKLNDDDKETQKFETLFKDFVASFGDKFHVNEESGKAISINYSKLHFASEQRYICGQIDGGTTGVGSRITRRDNVNDPDSYPVTTDKVNAMPYYFLLWLPKDSNIGLLLIQGYGNRSITDSFKSNLKSFCSNKMSSYVLLIGPHVPNELVEKMKKNPVVDAITLRKNGLPSTKGEKLLGIKYTMDRKISIEVKVTGLKNIPEMGNRMKDYLSGKINSIIDIEDMEEIGIDDTAETKITFEHNGKKAMGKASNNFTIHPSYYIDPNDLMFDEMRHATFDSMNKYCLSFLEKMKTEINYKKSK